MKLMQKLTKPRTFSHSVSHYTIVGFVTGARDCSLAFGDRTKVVTEIYPITGSGPASIRAASPISGRVRDETTKKIHFRDDMCLSQ